MNKGNLPERRQFYLAQEAALAEALIPEQTSASVENPKVFSKDVLSVGNFTLPKTGQKLNINPEQLEAIIADTNKYLANGNRVEFIADHMGPNNKPFENFDNQKEKNSVINVGGYCEKFSMDGDWANCEIGMTTDGGVQLAQSTKDVSIELDYDYTDTQGNFYNSVIRKVAGVLKPIIPGQSGYKKKFMLSEYFADTETFVLTKNQNEDDSMSDENKEADNQMSLFAKVFAPFMKKELKLAEGEGGNEGTPSPEDKHKADLASMKVQLDESDMLLKAEQKKTDKANKELEKSLTESLVGSAKKFVERIGKLPIQADAKAKLQFALGIDEDIEKMNKVYLSEDADGNSLADEVISIIEGIQLISTKEKTITLSEYQDGSATEEKDEAEAIAADAKTTAANLGLQLSE